MIGVSLVPWFDRYSNQSTAGRSSYSTASQRMPSPVFGSVQVSVCCVRTASNFLLSTFFRLSANSFSD